MKAVSGTQMRSLDRRTIEEKDIPGERLMQIAGLRAGAALLKSFAGETPGETAPDFLILAVGSDTCIRRGNIRKLLN